MSFYACPYNLILKRQEIMEVEDPAYDPPSLFQQLLADPQDQIHEYVRFHEEMKMINAAKDITEEISSAAFLTEESISENQSSIRSCQSSFPDSQSSRNIYTNSDSSYDSCLLSRPMSFTSSSGNLDQKKGRSFNEKIVKKYFKIENLQPFWSSNFY